VYSPFDVNNRHQLRVINNETRQIVFFVIRTVNRFARNISGADGIGGVVAVPADGGKEARANAVQGTVAGGDVYLPDEHHAKYPDGRVGAAWVPAFVHECTSFPKGENDDQVDGMTQHLNAVSGSYAARLKSAMGNGRRRHRQYKV
jgi:predicted phage terminase large subunit-like protein